MDLKKIKALLERYYNGETNLAEEKILLEYFNKPDISEDLIANRDIFLFNKREIENIENTPDISDEIWNNISKEEKTIIKKKNLGYVFLRIAASILVILASFYLIKDQLINKDGIKVHPN